ncbi:hypothetical protein L195_g047516 [Trifolium pratense]|uniref:RNase H type-1 domain-containing protein n=1 Tax=Trifolium pratense TaxID=57577 RepID=A0A2K3JKD2_TRIPR|nr:hypothetical protein L195_g048107 [Trifolium pratense]PNX55862.1 hypothetical protein L195_g049495 [Trifolium pratense]PNX91385.1 hypothetical protein L195_g047516 [Trifolium pratense]
MVTSEEQHADMLGHSGNSATMTRENHQWPVPALRVFKCNVVASIFREYNCDGAGMCVEDDNGNFIRAHTLWRFGSPLPHEAEAWGLKIAII